MTSHAWTPLETSAFSFPQFFYFLRPCSLDHSKPFHCKVALAAQGSRRPHTHHSHRPLPLGPAITFTYKVPVRTNHTSPRPRFRGLWKAKSNSIATPIAPTLGLPSRVPRYLAAPSSTKRYCCLILGQVTLGATHHEGFHPGTVQQIPKNSASFTKTKIKNFTFFFFFWLPRHVLSYIECTKTGFRWPRYTCKLSAPMFDHFAAHGPVMAYNVLPKHPPN